MNFLILLSFFTTIFIGENPCDRIADNLRDSLKYPPIWAENLMEANLKISLEVQEGKPFIKSLGNANHFENYVFQELDEYEFPTVDDCKCLFNIDFDIAYLPPEKSIRYDSLKVSKEVYDSLKITYTYNEIFIKTGLELSSFLDSTKIHYEQIKSLGILVDTTTNLSLFEKKFLKSKDSILVKIKSLPLLMPSLSKEWFFGLRDSKSEWFSKGEIIDSDLESAFKTLSTLPNRPAFYPVDAEDGVTYKVHIKNGTVFRLFYLSNPKMYFDNYDFWIEEEFLRILKKKSP